jgi:hypothetical protein
VSDEVAEDAGQVGSRFGTEQAQELEGKWLMEQLMTGTEASPGARPQTSACTPNTCRSS